MLRKDTWLLVLCLSDVVSQMQREGAALDPGAAKCVSSASPTLPQELPWKSERTHESFGPAVFIYKSIIHIAFKIVVWITSPKNNL